MYTLVAIAKLESLLAADQLMKNNNRRKISRTRVERLQEVRMQDYEYELWQVLYGFGQKIGEPFVLKNRKLGSPGCKEVLKEASKAPSYRILSPSSHILCMYTE